MKLFDSHCHLDDKSYSKDLPEVINRALDTNVAGIMLVGVNRETSVKALEIAQSFDGFYAAVGFHPHDARECSEEALEYLKSLSRNFKVKAWGEIGLDFNRMYSSRKDQETWFVRQLETAVALGLPVIFHERDSHGRLLEILKSRYPSGIKGVIHCFSGNSSELEQYLELGLYIGITGILTLQKRGADLRTMVPLIPRHRLLVETDAPYLTPAPEKNRHRRNEPAFVKSTLLRLAAVRGQDPESLADIIFENTCRLYNINSMDFQG
ncbi:MAG: TatD family hydrolase [Deltaproteobacteria bacterium]|nr:TatD family hydrolase [Deltaproteobacteria bacterium]MBW2592842.1 TatD family hydrolase [Deltaproteobacteria bacterium]